MSNGFFELRIAVPKGMRRKDYESGYRHGYAAAKEDHAEHIEGGKFLGKLAGRDDVQLAAPPEIVYEHISRLLDLVEVYGAHVDLLDHTRKSQRGMLKKQGKEIVKLRKRVEDLRGAMDSMQRTNGRLARAFNSSSEVLWAMAGFATNDTRIVKLRQQARQALAQRIRDENR